MQKIYHFSTKFLEKNDKSSSDYYGGAYIDEETGELVVLLTELAPIATNSISAYAEGNDNIRFQLCDVSYAQIEEAISTISNHITDLYGCGIEVVSIRDDILNGHVVVGVVDLDQEKEEMIRIVADYDFLVFEESERSTPLAAYGAGCAIQGIKESSVPKSNDSGSTIGFAARMDGKTGFVMAGHAGWVIGQRVKAGNTVLGAVTKSTLDYPVSTPFLQVAADAAFVQAGFGVSVTNVVDGTYIANASTYELPINTPIYMRGSRSLWTSGKVLGINAECIYRRDDGQLVGVCNCSYGDYSCVSGDSGAPILFFGGTQGGSTYYSLAGIAVAITNGYSYFSPYNRIVAELGVNCITG